ncbi:hypothetical protein B566_EDAN006519 [Ephemera danica]|nr:hypothetical protein B566_EDAN006519 [Ephemera danica]
MKQVIQLVQPHIVTVELCKSRISLLQLDEETILREAKSINFAKIHMTVQQNGVLNGLMYILLLSLSANLTKQLGMAPGGEFRRAMVEAGNVPKCCVHLGDRPINITLHRALSSLSWWQTLKLAWHMIFSDDTISKEEVERCKQRDLLEEMLAEMAGEFPALGRVFVQERDLFLAHSLALACQPVPQNGGVVPAKVVGVVGIGHVPGIIQHWGRVTEDDIAPIMQVPPRSMTSRIVVFSVKACTIGLVIWGVYKVLPVPRINLSKLWKVNY